jgi:hypothetical protein
MENKSLGPKDTVDQKIYRALSLDGGGARGLFTLSLLTNIAKSISIDKKPFYTHFDIIVGLSIGGIIGAAISTGIFENEDKRENLINDGRLIFGLKNDDEPLFAPTYTGIEKKQLLQKNFGNLKLKDCKVPLIIICTTINFYPIFFKSWLPQHQDLLICDVLNATSAAPSYFPPVPIHLEKLRYFWDGGMFTTCPTDLTALELLELYDQTRSKDFKFRILSIGTAILAPEPAPKDEPEIVDPNGCGLFVIIQLGVRKAVGGLYNDTSSKLMRRNYGEDTILRLAAEEIDRTFDDVSDEYQMKMKKEATNVFETNRNQINHFFSTSR